MTELMNMLMMTSGIIMVVLLPSIDMHIISTVPPLSQKTSVQSSDCCYRPHESDLVMMICHYDRVMLL